jgi:uncharacterized protein (DUF885 family)
MGIFERMARVTGGLTAAVCMLCSPWAAAQARPQPKLPQIIQEFAVDLNSIESTYRVRISAVRGARLEKFYTATEASLSAMDFNGLSHDDQIDYLLLRSFITARLHQLALEKKQIDEMTPLLPFAAAVEDLLDKKRLMQHPDAELDAKVLTEMVKQIETSRKQLEATEKETHADAGRKPKTDPAVANRAALTTERLSEDLHNWFDQYNGYDPEFSWWVGMPYKAAQEALKDYAAFLREKVAGIAPGDKTAIIGDPVGRDALLAQLGDDMIPYTPEELIAIAQTEYDWCLKEMLKASHEMGYGDDWHAAVEKVKQMHVAPGEQPDLIRKLVIEGSDFAKKNDLVTVPALADETWRMIMMTPERQLVNPFFTGGDEISVSYPTDTMTYEQREMSMRGNNIPFARATAFHEMIPGHFLQFYMQYRYRNYRGVFSTPFWTEGNAFWWEMLFWEKGFDRTPEERVGALVWRMHRSARVIFTMNFHLGHWTPQQCVQYLIDKVDFEPDNAAAEVRRSFDGSVGPLYQSAYLLGALQFRALHQELVGGGKMTDRQFHDAILHENNMPIELLRADLENRSLTRDFKTNWKFYGDHPTYP